MTKISRSTRLKLKHANKNKLNYFEILFNDIVLESCKNLVDHLLYQEEEPMKLIRSDIIKEFLPIHGRLGQVLANQCSSIVRSIRNKVKDIKPTANLEKYQYEIKQKLNEKSLKISDVSCFDLDSRFVNIEDNIDSVEFDYWVSVHFPGFDTVKIPIYETKHMRNLISRGYQLKRNCLKINKSGEIQLFYYKSVEPREEGVEIGLDVGRNKSFVTSRNETESLTKEILNSLKRQKHGSKNKARRVRRLQTLIDRLIKQNIDWSEIKTIVLEKLTNMKPGKSWGNVNHHWSYRYIQNRIRLTSEELGVQVIDVNPTGTSQTCSKCGHKHKDNRKGEEFLCLSCGYEADADFNASVNILERGRNRLHG